MNDDQLRSALETTFRVQALDASHRSRIWQMATRVRPTRSFALVQRLGVFVVGGIAVGCAYPIVNANYISVTLARSVRLSQPMTVTMSFTGHLPPGSHVMKPTAFTLADGWMTCGDATTFSLSDGKTLTRYFGQEHRSVRQPCDLNSLEQMLRSADKLVGQFEQLRLDRKVRDLGDGYWKGRAVHRILLIGDDDRASTEIDSDRGDGLPVRMVTGVAPNALSMSLEFNRNPDQARKLVRQRLAIVKSAPFVDKDRDRGAIVARYASSRVTAVNTGRDVLTVYSVETNQQGDVFVLYTLKGYHGDEGRVGNMLRLADGRGTDWLSSAIDFSFSGFKLNGEGIKAQVFFQPRGRTVVGPVRLYARMEDWEFIPGSEEQLMTDTSNRVLEIATVNPKPVATWRPDWMLYSFSVDDPRWLEAEARKLRLVHAVRVGDYRYAQAVGKQLEDSFPEMMSGFFYDRLQLDLALYRAFAGTHDRELARRYLRKAIDHREEATDSFQIAPLEQARKVEGM